MKLFRKFIAPQNAADEITLESVKAAFGIAEPPAGGNEPPANVDPPQNTPPAETDPPADPPVVTDPPPTDPPANTTPPAEPEGTTPPVDKVGQAFAQQRIQIKQYQQLVNGVAKVLGVEDTSNPDAVMTKLNDLIIKSEAKNNNVPEEIYRRLQIMEQQNQEFTQQKVRENAYFGFQKVKDQFKLDDAGLNNFANGLLKNGVNPFETPMDLVKEYQTMHFNDLIEAAKAEGARLEAERAANAANHSSTPNNKQGQGVTDPEKITTVSQLADWINKHETK